MNALHTLSRAFFFTILLGLLAAPSALLAQNQTNDPLVDQQQYLFDVHRVDQAWSYTTGSSNVKIGVYSQTGFIQNHEDLSSSRLASPVGTLLEPELDIASEMAGIVGASTNNNVGMTGIDRAATLQSYSVLTENSTCGSDSRCSGDEEDTVTFERPDGTQETYYLNLYRLSDQLSKGRSNGVDVHLFSYGLPSGDPADYDPTLEGPPDPDESMDLFDRDPDDLDDPDPYKTLATAAWNTIKSIGQAICGGWFGSCTTPPDPGSLFRDEVGFAVAKDGGVVVTPAGNLDGDGDIPPRHLPGMFDPYAVTVGGVDQDADDTLVKWDSTRPAAYVDVSAFAEETVGISGTGSDQYDTEFTTTAASASIGAGVSGLLKAEMPTLTGEDIEEILKRTARDAGSPGRDDYTGAGAIDADAALSFVRNNDVQRSRQSVKSVISKKKIRSGVDLRGNRYWNFTTVGFQNCPVAQGDLYEFKARVPYSQTFSSTPDVWVRWGKSNGYNSRIGQVSFFNPLIEGVQVVDVDERELTIRGHYWEADFFDSWGRRCAKDQRIPKVSKNFNIAYTAVGTEGPPPPPPLEASLSGPTYLDEGEQGTWTAYTSRDGASYTWSVDQGSGWYQIGSGPSVSWGQDYISSTIIVDIKVEASKNGETASAQTKVTINNNGGGGGGGGGCNAVGLNRICLAASEGSFVLGNVRAETHTNGSIHVSWKAVGESDLPSEFALQHRADSTAEWSTLGTVPAGDSMSTDSSQAVTYRYRTDELEIGTHQFRVGLPQDTGSPLRAVGNSETSNVRRYTKPVTAEIAMDEAYRLSTYPNPVQQRASVELAVKERQNVSVRLYDLLGRRVATLHDGPLPAQELQRLRLDVSSTGFTSGTYFLRATGEDFATTEQITVVR
jgi:hypothetical protein